MYLYMLDGSNLTGHSSGLPKFTEKTLPEVVVCERDTECKIYS